MAISRASSAAAAAEQAAAEEAHRKRAARQAAKVQGEPETIERVTCRVTKKGDGKISMGQHIGGIGEVHFDWKETFDAELPTAMELEERGLVEIESTPKADV